jgi:hypothetical protein
MSEHVDFVMTAYVLFGLLYYSIMFVSCTQRFRFTSRVGAVALYTVLWTVVVKYRKWRFSAPHRTKTH